MNVIEDARAEFERQARELLRELEDMPEGLRRAAIESELGRFSHPRYAKTSGAAVDILRAALDRID